MNCTCGGTFQSDGFCDTCGDPQVKPALTPPTPLPSAPAPSARQAASNAPAAVDGAPCQEAGCAGHYDGGYCDNCGSAPKPVAVAAPLASEAAPA